MKQTAAPVDFTGINLSESVNLFDRALDAVLIDPACVISPLGTLQPTFIVCSRGRAGATSAKRRVDSMKSGPSTRAYHR